MHDLQGEDGDDTNMVAEILLQFKENLSVHPGKRYTTRTVTGAQPFLCRGSHAVVLSAQHAKPCKDSTVHHDLRMIVMHWHPPMGRYPGGKPQVQVGISRTAD
jgi:hypothetical protein